MRRPPAALIRAVLGDTATAALLLTVVCGSALAAVDTHCEVHAGVSAPSGTDVDLLSIELVDLGDARTLPAASLDGPHGLPTAIRPQAVIDASILRQIFDESVPTEIEEPDPATAAPLAEVNAPALEDAPATLDADDGDELPRDEEAPNVVPRVPGVSDDDMRRYRQRMYRTDI